MNSAQSPTSNVLIAIVVMCGLAVSGVQGQLVWSQEFDEPEIDKSVWTFDAGNWGFGNGELQYHTARSENAYIENNNLVIEARRESYKGSNAFTSARLKTQGRFAFKYGTLEARIKVPDLANGLWPAFWMLGNNFGQLDWPACGEIDILEMGMRTAINAGVTNRMVHAGAFWDYQGEWANYGDQIIADVDLNNDYHLYKLVWTPSELSVYLDDIQFWTMDITDIETHSLEEFHRPYFILVNLSVGGWNFVEITDPGQITAPFPAKMHIDYIRLYANPYTELFYGDDIAETGDFGVFTETHPVDNHLSYDEDTALYIWNNLTAVSDDPYEGDEVLSFTANPGTWFGMGMFCFENRNMKDYSDGYLNFHMKTTTTAPFRIGIKSSGAGESWLPLIDGAETFGLVRDGLWHEVKIPLNRFANIDFHTIQQIFMLAGDPPAAPVTISIDNIYWSPSVERPTPANGNFGVFTETAAHKDAGEFEMGTGGDFFVWENTLSPRPQTPFEGENSISLGSTPGMVWFGAAFTPNVKHNLTAYRYPDSKLRFAIKTSSNTTFMIGMKSGNVEDIGQKWITFRAGSDPYGLVRNGNWQVIEIPMADFLPDVDLSQVSQLFQILGVDGPIGDIELDDICFINGGDPLFDDGNIPPAVSIVSPQNGQFFDVGDTITIEATASDADGFIEKVEFFEGTTLLGERTAEPYTFVWDNVPGGAYTLIARATDNEGTARNTSVRVYVGTPTLNRIAVTPGSAAVEIGHTRQFNASGYDQFNLPFAIDPVWSVSGGGTIDSSGLFAASFPGGPFTVTAQDSEFSATASVNVTRPPVSCVGGPANGDYTYAFSADTQNPTITFVPGYAGVGNNIVILYYGTALGGTYPGYIVSPNVPFQITASQGQTVYFYYTYSVPEGGERNTADNRHSVVVGSCTAVSIPGDVTGDGLINMDDLIMIAYYWLAECDSQNDFCFGADTQEDGIVNLHDLETVLRNWLK